jgi:Amt family ammonium transporter
MMHSFAAMAIIGVLWVVVGYSMAFGDGTGWFGWNWDYVLLQGIDTKIMPIEVNGQTMGIPWLVFAMFQGKFAIITPALISGAFAERVRFKAYCIFIALWSLLVYVPLCHWVWASDGFLAGKAIDFAGGTVIHISAGVAGLVSVFYLGVRKGYPKTAMHPSNLVMTMMGAGLLWVGWFGFNAGSALGANNTASMAMLVTHLSAACGALAWMTMEWVRHGKPSVLGIVTGMVAGLGTITPASGSVGPAAAVVIGLTAGVVCYFATNLLRNVLKVDDSLDVFPVHGVGGILGTLLAGIFCSTQLGIFSGNGFSDGIDSIGGQFAVQATGVVVTFVYTAVMSYILLKLVNMMVGLRVDADEENQGLDLVLHDERGYDL